MESMDSRTLSLLPSVVIWEIICLLDWPSLLCLSRVDRRLRQLCVPEIFKSVTVRFTRQSFNFLEELTASPILVNVRSLEYEALGFLDPGMTYHPAMQVYY